MLRIRFDNTSKKVNDLPNCDNVCKYAPIWFDHNYYDDWLNDEFVKHMVKIVDESDLIGKCVISPVLGSISVRDLSGGVKTCISIYKEQNNDGIIFDTRSCGDNCVPIFEEIGRRIDVEVNFSHPHYEFSKDFEFICVNDGELVRGYDAYWDKLEKYMILGTK